jgi:hypothetical protein
MTASPPNTSIFYGSPPIDDGDAGSDGRNDDNGDGDAAHVAKDAIDDDVGSIGRINDNAVSDVVNVDAAHGGNDASDDNVGSIGRINDNAVSDVVNVDAAHGGNDASAVNAVSGVVNVDEAATAESSSLHSDYSGDDLIDRLMANYSKKKGKTAPAIQARVSKRAHVGKVDMDKPCSCGCGRRPSEKSCPLCGSFTRAISMHCWMKGQVCSFCRNHNK